MTKKRTTKKWHADRPNGKKAAKKVTKKKAAAKKKTTPPQAPIVASTDPVQPDDDTDAHDTGCPPEHIVPSDKAVVLPAYKDEQEPQCSDGRTFHMWTPAANDEQWCCHCALHWRKNRTGANRYRRDGDPESTALEKFEGLPHTDPLVGGTFGQLRELLITGDLTLRVYAKVHTISLAASRLLDTLNPQEQADAGPTYLTRMRRDDDETDGRPTSGHPLDRQDPMVRGIQAQFETLLSTPKVTAQTLKKIAHLADYALVVIGQLNDKILTIDPDAIDPPSSSFGFSNDETFGAKSMRSLFDTLKPKPSLVPIVEAIAKARKLQLATVEAMLMTELEKAIAS